MTAQARPAQLTIGQGWAWVREFFPSSGSRDVETIVWSNPPPQIDLDTLQVWGVRRPWPIRDWRWQESGTPAATAEGQPLVWTPKRGLQPPPFSRERLEIRLAAPLSHRMGHSLTYRLPGIDWHSFYRVVVRGIGPESIQSVQVDLTGALRILNDTPTAFPEARISLLGFDPFLRPPPKPFGQLELNPDTPLSDLWLALHDPIPLLPLHYPLQTPADIPAKGQAEIQFARVDRKPAQITHLCDSGDIPSPTQSGGLPLRRMLLVPNTPAMGLGFPLPPGDANIFLGAVRGAPIQAGHVFHTPFPGTLQIDMGSTDNVRATRQTDAEVPLPEGAWQTDHSISLANQLNSEVHVRIVEKPTTPMQWNLVRSSIPCTVSSRELQFELTVPPRSSITVAYRLRLLARAE